MPKRQKDSSVITLTYDEVRDLIDGDALPEELIDAFNLAAARVETEFDQVISIIVTMER